MTGKFVAFEGVDGCGKSTQAALFADHLRSAGHTVLMVREPGGTELGEHIRSLLLDQVDLSMTAEAEMLLFLASRVQLHAEQIAPALQSGHYVISDRYHLSTLVYQGIAGKVPEPHCRLVLESILGQRRPHLNVLIETPLSDCLERSAGADRFESRPGFLQSVHSAFAQLVPLTDDVLLRVSGEGTPEQVFDRVMDQARMSIND